MVDRSELERDVRPLVISVEDDPVFRIYLARMLDDDLDLRFASGAVTGRQLLAESHPRLILLDIVLPDGSGHDLLAAIGQLPHLRQVPVLMVTGHTSAHQAMRSFGAGARGIVDKRVPADELRRRVLEALRRVPQGHPDGAIELPPFA